MGANASGLARPYDNPSRQEDRRASSASINQVGSIVKVSTRWKRTAHVGVTARTLPPTEDFTARKSMANFAKVDKLVRVGSYRIVKTLGEGAFAKVKLAVHIITGEKVAIKIFDKQQFRSEYESKHFYREADMGQRLLNEHCCQLLEVIDTETMYVLVFELIATDVLAMVEKAGQIQEGMARHITRQLIAGVQGMHAEGVVHRDLKPENIGLDKDNNVKILDFGLSGDTSKRDMLDTQCGTLSYSAPELLSNKPYGPSVDVWSIGVVLYSMLTGFLPYAGETSLTTLHANMLDQQFELPEQCSDDLADLFRKVFEVKPKKRITLEALWDHPWIKAAGDAAGDAAPAIDSAAISHKIAPAGLDAEVLGAMVALDFVPETIESSVCENLCNPVSSTYHLLLKAKLRDGTVPTLSTKHLSRKTKPGVRSRLSRLSANKRRGVDDGTPRRTSFLDTLRRSITKKAPASKRKVVAAAAAVQQQQQQQQSSLRVKDGGGPRSMSLRPRTRPNADAAAAAAELKATTLPRARRSGKKKAVKPWLTANKVRVAPAPDEVGPARIAASKGRTRMLIR